MDKSGNIWSWGSGKNGEFASGFADNRNSPKEIVNNYPLWTKIWSGGPGNEIISNIGYNLAINVH